MTPGTRSLLALVPLALSLAVACGRSSPPAPRPSPVAKETADPVVAQVDLSELRLSQVQDRLDTTIYADSKADAAAQALQLAVSDVLVVREMAVIGQKPLPGERFSQASDRFLAQVWTGRNACPATEPDLKWAYLSEMGRYKHPPSFTLWDAQVQCCEDVDACPQATLQACRDDLRPMLDALRAAAARELAALPPLPVDVTQVALDQSAVRDRHVPAFEGVVANASAHEPRLQLRRYTAFAADPAFPRRGFRRTDPQLERMARDAALGSVVGPIETVWGLSVALIVAREPPAEGGLEDPAVRKAVHLRLCELSAVEERQAYRGRLLKGALVKWRDDLIRRRFGDEVVRKLPRREPLNP
jgi:hypothetical protein